MKADYQKLILVQQLRSLDPDERALVARFVRKLEKQAARRRAVDALSAWIFGKRKDTNP